MIKVLSNNIVLVVTLLFGIYFTLVPIEYKPGVIFLDVGQGDAILLIDSSGRKILIDGGDGDYVIYQIAEYLHPRDRVIDIIILTHPHQDHMSGLIDIMERYEVREIYYYPVCYRSALYDYFLNIDEEIMSIPHDYKFIGESFSLEVLYPLGGYNYSECLTYSNINNASIVTRLVSESGSILFTGDAEHEQENILMNYYANLQSDILKAGHHCSHTASSLEFLTYVNPNYVVCCVGEDNRFGHPHKEVIDALYYLDIDYDLTYEEGDIYIEL